MDEMERLSDGMDVRFFIRSNFGGTVDGIFNKV
jgi:hypothetical protein